MRAGGFAVAAALALAGCERAPPDPALAPARHEYGARTVQACVAGKRLGGTGRIDDWRPPGGPLVLVRTPSNYRAELAHPLLLVFPGAGQSAAASERFVRLTALATAEGFIVAYPPSRRLSEAAVRASSTLIQDLAANWCIDVDRVVVAGHSDGGTTAAALGFLPDVALRPTAIIASAAGLRRSDLDGYVCPSARPVLVLGQSGDKHFPGYARELASWYAECNACATVSSQAPACEAPPECKGAPVQYCEGSGNHMQWPPFNDVVRRFLRTNTDPALTSR